jgi:protein-tyrosine phosphatase
LIVNKLAIQNSYWVIPKRFLAGEHPGNGSVDGTRLKLRWLMASGVNLILDLTEISEADVNYPFYLKEEASNLKLHLDYKKFPLQDWATPSPVQIIEILDTIDRELAAGRKIYLHCFGGKGRTGTIVGCYLARHGTPGDEVLGKIQELRRYIPGDPQRSPETDKQRKMVTEWIQGK